MDSSPWMQNGNLVTANGYPLVWDGEIPEGMTDIRISPMERSPLSMQTVKAWILARSN